MSDTDARWVTTTPEARLNSGPDKVSVRDSLPPGTRLLDEFEVLRVLGTGGFGVVYLARDHVLQRDVAVKEYLPALLARRGQGLSLTMRASTPDCAETFEKGLASFLGEARLLASFDHPALVKVHRFWRGNGTAYMAMPYYPGQTLRDARLQMLQTPAEASLHSLIAPLLGALELLHAHDVFHRDIAPDNILLLPDGRPVLLDFGCARRAVASGSRWFTAHLKPQFAPLEQYAEDEGVGQGPWTDLYALGATLYFVLTGRAPVPSVVRAARDTLPALSTPAARRAPASPLAALSPRLLATIDWLLALAPGDRPQDVATVRRALLGEIVPPRPTPRFVVPPVAASATPAVSAPEALPSRDEAVPSRDEGAPPAPQRPRGGMRPAAALLLAFAGLGAVGWGAFGLRPDAPAVSGASPREAIVLREALEMPATAPTRPTSSQGTPPAPLAVTVPTAISGTAPPVSSTAPPPVATVVSPSVAASPSPVPAVGAERVSVGLVEMQAMPPPVAAPRVERVERVERSPRPPKRSAARSAAAASPAEGGVCSVDAGMLSAALCVLNPCRDPKGRTSAQCADRRRAEAERLRRMASAG